MDCIFAKEVWGLILQDFQISVPPQTFVSELFTSWSLFYHHRIPIKSFWCKFWIALPKYVCWQFWLACNELIFKDLQHSPLHVADKDKSFLLEAAQQQYYKEDSLLLPEEKRWLGLLEPYPRKYLLTP